MPGHFLEIFSIQYPYRLDRSSYDGMQRRKNFMYKIYVQNL